jgi:hypothetical protein
MLGKHKWLSITLMVAVMTIGLDASVDADTGTEQGFLSAINSSRSANGLGPLTMNGSLQTHARNHTADMIAAGEIYHSSDSELRAAAGSGWSKLGENVGRGGTVESLHNAFMDSSGHRANILGDYNYVGIGTAQGGDYLYVTVVFMKKGSTAPAATTSTTPGGGSASPTTTTAKPKPTTTTTNLPPTTTTTLIVGPDKPVTPGESCFTATRLWWMCHD